ALRATAPLASTHSYLGPPQVAAFAALGLASMCLVWRRFEPLRYFPVYRADGVDGTPAIRRREFINDSSHPGDQAFNEYLLLTGGNAGAGLPPAPPIIPVIAAECRHAHVVSAGCNSHGRGRPGLLSQPGPCQCEPRRYPFRLGLAPFSDAAPVG